MQSGKSLKPLGKTAHLSIGSVTSSISPPPPTPSLVSEGNLTLAYSYCCPGSQVSYMLLSPSLMPHLHLTRSGTEVWPKSNRFLSRLCSLGLKKMNWIHLFPGGNLNKGPPSHKSIFQLAIRLNWTYFLSLNVLGDVMWWSCSPGTQTLEQASAVKGGSLSPELSIFSGRSRQVAHFQPLPTSGLSFPGLEEEGAGFLSAPDFPTLLCLLQGVLRKFERQLWKWKCWSLSLTPWTAPWTVARQAPLSMEFSRQEYWCGMPFPSPGDLPDPGIEPESPVWQADSLPSVPPGSSLKLPFISVNKLNK